MHLFRALAALALALPLALAACGSSGDTASGTPAPKPAATSATKAAKPARAAKITIAGFEYRPGTIAVKTGTRITWTDSDSANHSVTADDGSFDVGNIAGGARGSHTFANAGAFAYHCTYHPNMHGRVVVR